MSEQLIALLEKFQELRERSEYLPTMLEVTGFQYKEDAWSNILAFFLNPANPHGLGTLFLDALVCAGNFPEPEAWSGVSVEREKTTDRGNKIDICIESDSHVIVIENKIFAEVTNPLSDYAEFARSRQPRDRHVCLFLLTRTDPDVGRTHGFCNVTHGQLAGHIRAVLGHYVSAADTRYLILLFEVLNTADIFKEGRAMDLEFLNFLQEHHRALETLLERCYRFKRDELGYMVKKLEGAVGDLGIPASVTCKKKTQELGNPNAANRSIGCELRYLVEGGDRKVSLRAIAGPGGWEVRIGQTVKEMSEGEFQQWLQSLRIPACPQKGRESLLVENASYDRDIGLVARSLRDMVQKLANG